MNEVVHESWNEYWAHLMRVEHRHGIAGIFDWDRRLVTFIEEVCGLSAGARLLDLGCGGGDQAWLLAEHGYEIVGIDIAPPLVDFAREQFLQRGLQGEFIAGDMRTIDYTDEFDACLILSGTFGFFGDEEDQELLRSIRRALRAGGMLFAMFHPVAGRSTARRRTWVEMEEGWMLTETWFDPDPSILHSRSFVIRKDGTLVRPETEPGYHADEAIRCYSQSEMRAMLETAGLRCRGSYSADALDLPPGSPAPESAHNIVVAVRP